MPRLLARHVRGMLLEEAILSLLARTGYVPVDEPGTDPTLEGTLGNLRVRGRGTTHQVDAIGDFRLTMPFSHPARLLVEAKYYTSQTPGLDVVRNAASVVRDASEYFAPSSRIPSKRYHYQSAVFSASTFTKPAQEFAYAHDIFLVPLRENMVFRRVVSTIGRVNSASQLRDSGIRLGDLRKHVRSFLRHSDAPDRGSVPTRYWSIVQRLQGDVAAIGHAFLTRTTSGFPLFLVPHAETRFRLESLQDVMRIQVRYTRSEGWWIESNGSPLFSFDLPVELFRVFDQEGRLRSRSSSAMKRSEFEEIYAFRIRDGNVDVLVMQLDPEWEASVREGVTRSGE